MPIELRFFRERYNMDEDYYAGNDDVYCRLYFKTINELKLKWQGLFEAENRLLEGETYSAWYDDYMLCGGAFDPSDIEYIEASYEWRN